MKILSLLNCSDVEMDCRTLTSQLGEVSLVCGLTMIWFLVFIFLLVTCWSLNISLSPYILTVWIHMSQVLMVDCWSRSFNFLSSSSSYHYTKKYIYYYTKLCFSFPLYKFNIFTHLVLELAPWKSAIEEKQIWSCKL